MDEMRSIAETLPEQIARVQGMIDLYKEYPHGKFTAALMQRDVDAAHKAMKQDDLAGMIKAYKALLEWED
ncbi:hypothetical protein SDC9_176055 [bioreactor metagenome]|uniref:Uncharacterized protein n=1 Tax=bioreactor metagenome TaxID=1076179 RepID=A0A645GRP5_9ZZZZ